MAQQAQQPSSSTPPAQPPAQNFNPEQVPIRTMQDDLSQARQVPVAGAAPVQPTNAAAPLPAPATQQVQQPVSYTPPKQRHILRTILIVLTVLLVVGGGAAGAYWWFFLAQGSDVPGDDGPLSGGEDALQLPAVIPNNAQAILRYTLTNPLARSNIREAWGASHTKEATLLSLVAGDPRLVLNDSEIQEVVYVMIPDDPRPYLVVKKTAGTSQYLAEQSGVQAVEMGGWYIVHAFNTDLYSNALTAEGAQINLPEVTTTADAQLTVSTNHLSEFYAQNVSRYVTPAQSGKVVFDITLSKRGVVEFVTQGPTPNLLPPVVLFTIDQLAGLVPNDAEVIRVEPHFYQGISEQANQGTARYNEDVLRTPATHSFLEQLTGPYAYYERTGTDGFKDVGLVILLPPELQRQLALGDAVIEQALSGILPLVLPSAAAQSVPATPTFNDATHLNVPLRYVNIADPHALDYTVTDTALFVSTSKEGMFKLIETFLQQKSGITTSPPWNAVFSNIKPPAPSQVLFVGKTIHPTLATLLPLLQKEGAVPFALITQPSRPELQVSGIIGLSASSGRSSNQLQSSEETN